MPFSLTGESAQGQRAAPRLGCQQGVPTEVAQHFHVGKPLLKLATAHQWDTGAALSAGPSAGLLADDARHCHVQRQGVAEVPVTESGLQPPPLALYPVGFRCAGTSLCWEK